MMKKTLLICLGVFIGQICFSQAPEQKTEPTVIFQSGFEEGNKSIWDDWDGNPDSQNQLLADPGPLNVSGNHVIRLAVPAGERGGSDLVKVLPSQHDSLYVRWYIKYENGFNFDAPNHGGGLFAGDRNYLGRSDYRPDGNDYALSSIEYDTKLHTTQIYAYYRGMYQDCVNPNGSCWGDHFPCTTDEGQTFCEKAQHRDPPIPPTLKAGQWYCIEMKFKLGTASSNGAIHDGGIALWIDGKNYGSWNDLWIRTTDQLKLNILWLSLFHHDGTHSAAGVLIDDVTVSTTKMDFISSAKLQKQSQMLNVYPNPTNRYINIDLPFYNNYSVFVYDLNGRLLINEKIAGSNGNVSTNNLKNGIYNLVVKDKDGNALIASKKIICQ